MSGPAINMLQCRLCWSMSACPPGSAGPAPQLFSCLGHISVIQNVLGCFCLCLDCWNLSPLDNEPNSPDTMVDVTLWLLLLVQLWFRHLSLPRMNLNDTLILHQHQVQMSLLKFMTDNNPISTVPWVIKMTQHSTGYVMWCFTLFFITREGLSSNLHSSLYCVEWDFNHCKLYTYRGKMLSVKGEWK